MEGPIVSLEISDYIRLNPDQIRPFVRKLIHLGQMDMEEVIIVKNLRKFFLK